MECCHACWGADARTSGMASLRGSAYVCKETCRLKKKKKKKKNAFTIRPIAPDDKPALATFFSRLSEVSRRRRFLGPKPRLGTRELAFLTEVDQCPPRRARRGRPPPARSSASAATRWGGARRPADMAVAVIDEWHGRGLGTELGDRLCSRAPARTPV